MNKKGFLFIIESITVFLLIILLITSLQLINPENYNNNKIKEVIITQKISDLLITTQLLEITKLNDLEYNYNKLFPNNDGYIIINNISKNINNTKLKTKNHSKKQLISSSIKYIKSSNYNIYIEIGVYY